MGWRDRDWAQLDTRERRHLYGSGVASGARDRRSAVWLAVALLISLGLALALGHLPRGHPWIRALDFQLPFTSSHTAIKTITASYGSTYTLSGSTGGKNGTVHASGSWNGGPWLALTTTTAFGGYYTVRFAITQHGTLTLRVTYPGGEADGKVIVP